MKRYVLDYSLKNGLGKPAISLYLRGCDKPIHCSGCHNAEMRGINDINISLEELKKDLDSYITNYLNFHDKLRVAFLGGEPTASYNILATYELSKYVKERYNAETIIYSWKQVDGIDSKYLKYIDYGVLGEFDESKLEKNVLPSSSNQYIYDFNNNKKIKSIKLGAC